MHHMARAVRELLMMRPPEPTSLRPSDLAGFNQLAKHVKNLGSRRFFDLARLMTSSAADYLDRWFECDPLKATMSASGIIGTFLSPRSPGSAYVLLHHYMGEIDGVSRSWGFAKGGMGSVANALASSARSLGAEIRTGAGVAQVLTRDGRATGVVLESGEEIEAHQVASSADPKRTFLKLVQEKDLPADFVADVKRFKIRGSSGKVNLALSELPNFTCLPGEGPHLKGAISISPSLDYIERAYDEAKYGDFSSRPYMDVMIPTLIDPSLAPPGKHVMSIFVQYAPYKLKPGTTWEQKREAFGDAVIDTLSEYAPNLKKAIIGRMVLSPWDMEQRIGLTEGNIFHGELSLDQLFFLRPVAGWAQFRTPLEGLYLAGSGAHPGGGVMGAPGKLAALEMLKDAS
jgi:phytoene dehydrogenase-like protein